MTQNEVKKLLAMIATEDTDPDTFEFVLKRIMGLVDGIESDAPRESR
jgi:hypothetical protein